MERSVKPAMWPIGLSLLAVISVACSAGREAPAPAPTTVASETRTPARKAVEVEGVISAVGQRTITFQVERKGKVREEVVGVDDKTDIQKSGNRVKLRDLEATDKANIKYEPEAYTPAHSINVVGKGKIQKVGGDD